MRWQWLGIMALTLAGSLATPALALPNQSVKTVVAWAKLHPPLTPLKRDISELSQLPFYTSEFKTANGMVVFSMSPDRADQIVERETIAYGTKNKFSGFIRANSDGLNLVRQVYNSSLSSDFQRSKYVAQVQFKDYGRRFYQGQKFGYITTEFKSSDGQGQRFYHFTVVPLKDLASEITGDQQCRRSSEFGCGD